MDSYGICPFRPEGFNKDVCPHCTFFVKYRMTQDCVFKLAAIGVIDIAETLRERMASLVLKMIGKDKK